MISSGESSQANSDASLTGSKESVCEADCHQRTTYLLPGRSSLSWAVRFENRSSIKARPRIPEMIMPEESRRGESVACNRLGYNVLCGVVEDQQCMQDIGVY